MEHPLLTHVQACKNNIYDTGSNRNGSFISHCRHWYIPYRLHDDELESGIRKLQQTQTTFARTSKSKLVGVGIGTVATAAIQSSGATTVMVIGFVNAGIMSLMQAATVIYGANIGTTITGQITALGMFENSISTGVVFATFAGIGAFTMAFAKKDLVKKSAVSLQASVCCSSVLT